MTYEILNSSESDYIPRMALVVYSGDNNYYIESHRIDNMGRMGAGVPLSVECISMIANSFSTGHSSMPRGVVPDCMLYLDSRPGYGKYVWYNPPGKRMMFFSKRLNIPDGEYHVPGIVYVAGGDSLALYAYKGGRPKGKLFKAPFFNTTDGNVCLGNTKLEYPSNPSFRDIIKYWEDKFWLSEFSHLGGNCNPTRGNLVHVTKRSAEKFDTGELVPVHITLKDLLR